MAQAEHLPIYKRSYDLCLFLEQVVRGSWRYHKYTLGADLKGDRIGPDEFFGARRTYYEMAGGDPETGKPTRTKLAELRVKDAAARERRLRVKPGRGSQAKMSGRRSTTSGKASGLTVAVPVTRVECR